MSRFPFGIPGNKMEDKKQETGTIPVAKNPYAVMNEQALRYEQKLTEYEAALEKSLSYMEQYAGKLEENSRKPAEKPENQLSLIQAAVDLTYIKEQGKEIRSMLEELRSNINSENQEHITKVLAQGNKAAEQQESLLTTLIDTNYKLEGLDKNVVNRLTDVQVELQKQTLFQFKQNQTELQSHLDTLTKSVKRNKLLLWLVFVIQFLGLGALAFIILYLLEIIYL